MAVPALTPAGQLFTALTHGPGAVALAPLAAGRHPPAVVAGAVPVDGMAAAAPGTLTGELAQRTPAVVVAGALASDGVAAAVRVARTHLAAVRSPELRRTTWKKNSRPIKYCSMEQFRFICTSPLYVFLFPHWLKLISCKLF